MIDPDGRDPIILRFIQAGINNLPKTLARESYTELVNRAFNSNRTSPRIAARLDNEKYVSKSNSIIRNNFFSGEGNVNFYGKNVKLSYQMMKRDDVDKYIILDLVFRGNEKGPYLYGSGGAGDQTSGYFLELNSSTASGSIRLITLEFKDYEEMKSVQDAFNNQFNKEYNKLLDADPLIKDYKGLLNQQRDLSELYYSLQKRGVDPSKNKNYNKLEKEYLDASKEWAKKRDKMLKYEN